MTTKKKPVLPDPPTKTRKRTEHHYFSVDEIRDMLDGRVMSERRTAYRGALRFLSIEHVQHPNDGGKNFIRLTISDAG